VFLFHKDKMTYYDLVSNKWSSVVTLSKVIDDYRFTFDGSNTIIFGSILPQASPFIQYGADTQGLVQSILTLVLDENDPSKARFVSHPVTPFAGVDSVYPYGGAPIAYDPLRNRIYMAVSLKSSMTFTEHLQIIAGWVQLLERRLASLLVCNQYGSPSCCRTRGSSVSRILSNHEWDLCSIP
jgi:hypothetical protein